MKREINKHLSRQTEGRPYVPPFGEEWVYCLRINKTENNRRLWNIYITREKEYYPKDRENRSMKIIFYRNQKKILENSLAISVGYKKWLLKGRL